MLKIIQGDLVKALLLGEVSALAHGVNCSGGFASGIAGQIACEIPMAKEMYLEKYKKNGWKLADIQTVLVDENKIVFNCASQEFYGRDKKVYADIDAIKEIFKKLSDIINQKDLSLGIPIIGGALGGLNPSDIVELALEVFGTSQGVVSLYILDQEMFNRMEKVYQSF